MYAGIVLFGPFNNHKSGGNYFFLKKLCKSVGLIKKSFTIFDGFLQKK
jgi:hypothetical protein